MSDNVDLKDFQVAAEKTPTIVFVIWVYLSGFQLNHYKGNITEVQI